jgi:hypothetical protein
MTFAVAWEVLKRAFPYLAVIALALGAYFYAWNRGVQHEHKKTVAVEQEFAAYKEAQQKLAADLMAAWKLKSQEAEIASKLAEEERNARFAEVEKLRRSIPVAVTRQPVDRSVVGVLDAARSAANATGPAPAPDQAAPTAPAYSGGVNVGGLTSWMTEVIEIHAECRARDADWAAFYRGLQEESKRASR